MLNRGERNAAVDQRLDQIEQANVAIRAALKTAAAEAQVAAVREASTTRMTQELSARLLALETRALADAAAVRAAQEAIAALVERMAPLDGVGAQVDAVAADMRAAVARLDELGHGLDRTDGDIATLRQGIVWLEHQARSHTEQLQSGIAALLERIEPRGSAAAISSARLSSDPC